MDDFKTRMAEILEVDVLELNNRLESFDSWDSLALLSIIAMADEMFNVKLSGKEVNGSLTIGDLYKLMNSKAKL